MGDPGRRARCVRVTGARRCAGRPARRCQSTVEFALVFGLFLVMLLAIVDTWVWTIESDAVDAAVEQGIGVALSASGSARSATPALGSVYGSALPLLRQPLLGTSVDDWYSAQLAGLRAALGPGTCPSATQVADYFAGLGSGPAGVGHVVVCAIEDGQGHVVVTVSGYTLSLVPPGLGPLNWRGGGLPVFESASVTAGTYSP